MCPFWKRGLHGPWFSVSSEAGITLPVAGEACTGSIRAAILNALVLRGALMATCSIEAGVGAGIKAGNVLCVTDLSQHAERSLELAFQAADRCGVNLELIHVVDLSRAPSTPDAQVDIQFNLESLAKRLETVNRIVTPTLLFGCPEKAIAKRANDSNAALIAFTSGRAQSAVSRQILMARIRSRVTCPVIDLSYPKPSQPRVIQKLVLLPTGSGQ